VDVRVDRQVGDVVDNEAAVEVAERFGVLGGVLGDVAADPLPRVGAVGEVCLCGDGDGADVDLLAPADGLQPGGAGGRGELADRCGGGEGEAGAAGCGARPGPSSPACRAGGPRQGGCAAEHRGAAGRGARGAVGHCGRRETLIDELAFLTATLADPLVADATASLTREPGSYRAAARAYGVDHKTVRRIVARAERGELARRGGSRLGSATTTWWRGWSPPPTGTSTWPSTGRPQGSWTAR